MMRTVHLLCSAFIWHGGGQKLVKQPDFSLYNSQNCPEIIGNVYRHSKVVGSSTQGEVMRKAVGNVTDLSTCVDTCCRESECNVAMLYNDQCYMVSCTDTSYCLPTSLPSSDQFNSSLVLVRSPSGGSWPSTNNTITTKDAAVAGERVCEVNVGEECHQDEICVAMNDKSRNGVCSCADTMVRASDGSCVAGTVPVPDSAPLKLHVFVESQTITLPRSNSSLTAITTEEPTDSNPMKYVWKTVSMPSDGESAVESNKNTRTLTLSNLVEGVYQFRVIVSQSSPAGYGEALANVTVLPAARLNTPPQAVLEPRNQTVTLPTKKAIIDGSGSRDDTPLTDYLWELVSGPVGYQADLEPGSILTLSNLIVGNYTLKLTVTDQDGETDSDTATLEVVKDTDYKPKAVAGEDIVIYLPDNSVTLNGNQSFDDHKIVSWEWTKVKSEEGVDLPADISGTQTPAMTVSNMQPGQYNFLLRVTDEAGQSDEDTVKVYVKHPTNRPPSAVAGEDMELSLPLPFLTLNGSKSNDDGNITVYKWSLQSGPEGFKSPVLKLSCAECVVTNVTGLAVGRYVFRLMVEDNSGQTDSADITVLIKQDTNQPPVANPGSNLQISLPTDHVILDGSSSSDDLAVVQWQWSRDPDSLAAGTIVGNMNSPRLIITDLVSGTYSFNLKVSDDQGLSSNKSVKVTVAQDRYKLNTIELVLNKNLSHFTQAQKNDVLGRVRLLSKGTGELSVEDVKLYSSSRLGLATLQFKVFSTTATTKNSLSGVSVVAHLKKELQADAELLGVPVISIDTLICQNPCSGHGYCDQASRACVCQTAWMENILTKYLGQGESNCDWSVVYVSLASATIILVILSCCCFGTCKRKVVKIRAKRKYSRLNTSDNIEMTDETGGSLVNSDTESEEEILFESSKKGRRLNGSLPRTNGLKNGKLTA